MKLKKMLMVLALGIFACSVLSAAGLRFGMTGAVKQKVKELDKKVREKKVAAAAITVSGTAAAGAPIIGTVTLKDSATPFNTKTVTIAADGKYSVDVTGLTAPFILRADGTAGGRSCSLYSAAASADVNGTINITPLTDLIVANIAMGIVSNYFATGDFSALTTAELNTQENALQARLQPILAAAGLGDSIDLLRVSFAADHTDLDAALDALRVTVDTMTAIATITNIIDNQQITDAFNSQETSVIVTSSNTTTAMTEITKIAVVFDDFSARFATSMPAYNDATLLVLTHSNFMNNGQDRGAWLSELTSQNYVGFKLINITLVPGSLTPASAPTTAKVTFLKTLGVQSQAGDMVMIKDGGQWKMAGDKTISEVDVRSFAEMSLLYSPSSGTWSTGSLTSGISFSLRDPTPAGLSSIGASTLTVSNYYAVVTGSGLPTGGLLYVSKFQNPGGEFAASTIAPANYIGTATPQISYGADYTMTYQERENILDGSVYTIKLWNDGGTWDLNATGNDVLLATYTKTLDKRPYLGLSTANFPTLTAPIPGYWTSVSNIGGNLGIAWTLPTGVSLNQVKYERWGASGSTQMSVDDLSPTATSATLAVDAWEPLGYGTLGGTGITIYISDSDNRPLRGGYAIWY